MFRKVVADAGREQEFEIDSAGTIGYHAGNPADSRMRAAAARRGYRLESIARRLVADDYGRFQLIVATLALSVVLVLLDEPGADPAQHPLLIADGHDSQLPPAEMPPPDSLPAVAKKQVICALRVEQTVPLVCQLVKYLWRVVQDSFHGVTFTGAGGVNRGGQ